MTNETGTQWDLEDEVERLRDTVEEYYELLEQIVDAYESMDIDLEEFSVIAHLCRLNDGFGQSEKE